MGKANLKDQIQNKLGLKLAFTTTSPAFKILKDQIQNKLGLKPDLPPNRLIQFLLKDQIQNKLGLKHVDKICIDV